MKPEFLAAFCVTTGPRRWESRQMKAMKSAEQWAELFWRESAKGTDKNTLEHNIRRIQADALRWSAANPVVLVTDKAKELEP